jgi:hypothetical protein
VVPRLEPLYATRRAVLVKDVFAFVSAFVVGGQ